MFPIKSTVLKLCTFNGKGRKPETIWDDQYTLDTKKKLKPTFFLVGMADSRLNVMASGVRRMNTPVVSPRTTEWIHKESAWAMWLREEHCEPRWRKGKGSVTFRYQPCWRWQWGCSIVAERGAVRKEIGKSQRTVPERPFTLTCPYNRESLLEGWRTGWGDYNL